MGCGDLWTWDVGWWTLWRPLEWYLLGGIPTILYTLTITYARADDLSQRIYPCLGPSEWTLQDL